MKKALFFFFLCPIVFAPAAAAADSCVRLPVIFYHHIEPMSLAKKEGHSGLTVDPAFFTSQMQYLKNRGYNAASMDNLINFFDSRQPLPPKSILLTFDDGYSDFADYALPVLRQFGFQSTLFLPTGLVNNPGYLTWDTISNILSHGDVLIANHTWSHHYLANAKLDIVTSEIDTASRQLQDHGLPPPTVFAYPYGTPGTLANAHLRGSGFKLAFTTRPGKIMCKGLHLTLPRTRMGNSPASAYGL